MRRGEIGNNFEHLDESISRKLLVGQELFAISALGALAKSADKKEHHFPDEWLEKAEEIGDRIQEVFARHGDDKELRRMFITVLDCPDSELALRLEQEIKNVRCAARQEPTADYVAASRFITDTYAFLIAQSALR